MSKHPFRLAIETDARPEAFEALLAADVALHAPMLSQPVEGRDQVLRVIATAARTAAPLRHTHELSDGRQTFLFWSGAVRGFDLQAVTILIEDDDSLIREVRVLMRSWPVVTWFRDAMKEALGDAVPQSFWEPGQRDAPTGEARKFTPIALGAIGLAPDVTLHSPILAKPVKGLERVERSLKLAHSIQSASSYTSITARPDLVVELFECDADGYPMEGLWASRLNIKGQIDDLTVYLRPYPVVTVLRDKAKALAESDPDLAFLGPDYWILAAPAGA